MSFSPPLAVGEAALSHGRTLSKKCRILGRSHGHATGLLPQEARELWPTFSRDLPRQQASFCRGPASVSHGKSSPTTKNRKKSRSRKIDLLPLEKSLFFRRKNADFSARVARFFRKFWRSSGAKGRDLSLGFKASEKSEGTLPVQCDHSEAIPTVYTTLFGREEREIAVFGIYLGGGGEVPDCRLPGSDRRRKLCTFHMGCL